MVNKKDITIEHKERTCHHNTDIAKKFCSECGKPIYTIEKEMIVDEGYYPNEIGYFVSSYDSDEKGILGFKLIGTKDQDTTYYEIPEPNEKMLNLLKKF